MDEILSLEADALDDYGQIIVGRYYHYDLSRCGICRGSWLVYLPYRL